MVVSIRRGKGPARRLGRRPGERANLTPTKIVDVALDVLDADGLENFSARVVAKKLGVSPAAIYAHVKGGLAELKARMVNATLIEVARPYRPKDTPAGYLRDLFLRLLTAIHGKQPLAQLVALELSADYLVCPLFIERLLAVSTAGGRHQTSPSPILDLAMAMLLGMIMVEAETTRDDIARTLSNRFWRRVRSFPPNEVPALLANSDDLMMQIKRRLVPNDAFLRRTANRYAEPIIVALKLEDPGRDARIKH